MTESLLKTKAAIESGNVYLGIELGSTRIKAVLIDAQHMPVAYGSHAWENKLVDKIWTYDIADVWTGLQDCYADLAKDVKEKYGVALKKVGCIGFSAMMHGYMAFDKEGKLLVPFRTWRNTMTGEACKRLMKEFNFNIPQRWSVAHLYQAILSGEQHVKDVDYITTLSGYIHWRMTGRRVLGVGDASGMFPINDDTRKFDAGMIEKFDALVAEKNFPWKLGRILPEVLLAGQEAGALTAEGAKLLDPSGNLEAGIPLCPPEGDAGTGMTATNSVSPRTGNVSAGTSVFAMAVLEKALSDVYEQIDMVTTPAGDPVAMVHCNNCTGDLDAWVGLFKEFAQTFGMDIDISKLYSTLYNKALEGDADCGGLLAYNYFSGEHVTGFDSGRPLFARLPDSRFNLANFMRTHLYTALGALRTGMDILKKREHVSLDMISGHGGLFKVEGVGQRIVAAALETPVTVMETAGEGGPWGMAILAAFMQNGSDMTLAEYLEKNVFASSKSSTVKPDAADVKGFEAFMQRYANGLPIERAAVESL